VQVRLASVRRSLFSSEGERAKFLNRLVGGTREIMSSQHGLAHHDNYHELCRLLGRLKSNYQLNELVGLGAGWGAALPPGACQLRRCSAGRAGLAAALLPPPGRP
jgi:hypothetical protein